MGKIHTRLVKISFFVAALCLPLFSSIPIFAESVTLEHADTLQIGSTGTDAASGIAITSDNKKVVSGEFSDTVDFDLGPGTSEATSAGSTDAFLAVYDSDGSLDFVKVFGTTSTETTQAPIVDGDDNIYVTGTYLGTVDFDPGAGTDNLTSNGSTDIFISKYSSTGAYQWTKSIGGAGGETAQQSIVDENGFYMAGRFASTVDFDPGAGTSNKTSTNSSDPFTLKLTQAGIFEWVNVVASNQNDDGTQAVATDADGNVYASGYLRGTSSADFDPSGGTDVRAFTGYAGWLSKYDSSGGYVGTLLMSGAGTESVNGIAIDGEDLYITGIFTSTVDFDPGAGSYNVTSEGGQDTFITKLDTDLNWQWSRTIGGTSNDSNRQPIYVDSRGNVGALITFSGQTDLDIQGSGDLRTAEGTTDAIMPIFSADGDFLRAYQLRGSGTSAINVGIFGGWIMDSEDTVYVAGDFTQTINTADTGTNNIASAGGTDGFVTVIDAVYRQHITAADASITFEEVSTGDSAVEGDEGVISDDSTTIRILVDGMPVAETDADLSVDRDWSNVTAEIDTESGKSVIANLESAPGAASTHTLYVPYTSGSNAVIICPDAITLDEVTEDCEGATILDQNSSNVSIVTINSDQYWQIDGLGGTGGMSTIIDDDNLAETGTKMSSLVFVSLAMLGTGTIGIILSRRITWY